MHCRCTVEIVFRVSFYWDLLQFLDSLFLANLKAWSWLRIHHPTNSLSCEEHIIPVFWTNLEIFLSLVRTRCSIPVPPVPKRSSTSRFMIPATDFPAAGLPSIGSNIFSNAASSFDRTRVSNEMSLVPCHCVEHVWFQVRSRHCVWVEYNT